MDLSHLDKKYFLDARRYNCPFCNRGSVAYEVISTNDFHWSDERIVYIYLVQCTENGCQKISMHLSDFHFINNSFEQRPLNLKPGRKYNDKELDDYFFFHQPTSFFTVDSRINIKLRELISEAENCLKMNFLVGASACLRKTIYELIDLEEARAIRNDGHTDYKESIKRLKEKFNWVPKDYFDALSGIQELASNNVHEGSWEAWNSTKLRILIELTKNVLHEMYVTPAEQKTRVSVVTQLLGQIKDTKGKEQKDEGPIEGEYEEKK